MIRTRVLVGSLLALGAAGVLVGDTYLAKHEFAYFPFLFAFYQLLAQSIEIQVGLLDEDADLAGLRGNLALAASGNAAAAKDWARSAHQARTAHRWAPWSSEPWRLLGEAQYAEGQFAAARTSFRKAIAKDPQNWFLWAELGVSSDGRASRVAIRRALELNPLAPELAGYRKGGS